MDWDNGIKKAMVEIVQLDLHAWFLKKLVGGLGREYGEGTHVSEDCKSWSELRAVEIKLLADTREEQQDDSGDSDVSDDSDESDDSGDSEECPEGKHPNYHEYRSIEANIYHSIHSRAIEGNTTKEFVCLEDAKHQICRNQEASKRCKKSAMLIRYRILQYLPNSKGFKTPPRSPPSAHLRYRQLILLSEHRLI